LRTTWSIKEPLGPLQEGRRTRIAILGYPGGDPLAEKNRKRRNKKTSARGAKSIKRVHADIGMDGANVGNI